jgi:hypothetical protein
MGIPDNAAHYVISGHAGTSESFAWGWWVDDTAHDASSDIDISTVWSTFRTFVQDLMTPASAITDYDLYRYGGGVVVEHQHTAVSHPGTNTTSQMPLSTAMCVTTRSATLSRSGRGRMYLPATAAGDMQNSNFELAHGVTDNIVDQLALWFAAEAAAGIPAVVVSRVHGVMHPITSVDADYRPDVQRRRTQQQHASRHSATV